MTTLYRCFDADGRLLYVGISVTTRRFGQHRNGKGWWRDVQRVELEHFKSRKTAERAERDAIRLERPAYNLSHNADPDRGEQAAAIELGRGDWRVIDARFLGAGKWQVSFVTPYGGDLLIAGVEASTVAVAVEESYEKALRLLPEVPA
jgi:predicted GIY-YIG superfamily endonuclease